MDGSSAAARRSIDVVLPAHNERATIAATVDAWLSELAAVGVDGHVIVVEDGSTDGTAAEVAAMAADRPVVLLHDERRLGYSEAVVRGIRATSASLVVCADADGQCDPADVGDLLARWEEGDADVVVGRRERRADPAARRLMSAAFRVWFRLVHRISLQDPSSPFVLGAGDVLRRVATAAPELAQGYWWEFHVRARRAGASVVEVPVRHHPRADGPTRVYRPRSIVPLAAAHLVGIWRLRDRP